LHPAEGTTTPSSSQDAKEGKGQAWPTPAPLGAAPRTTSPASTPAPAEGVSGGLDAAALRAGWDGVLAEVKARKRTAHALLADAQVASLTGRTLVLAFQHAPILRQFQSSTGPDVLKESLQASLGADLEVTCVLHESLGGHIPPAAKRGSPVAAQPDFAPGDESVPEDPDAPTVPDPVRGEDAALELVKTQLGGTVVSSTGEA
jgi:hypothetical protein